MTSNQINYAGVVETTRHNKEMEKFNRKSLRETTRHNKQQEKIGYGNIDLGYANVGLGYSNLGELYRHNAATELQNVNALNETVRHNTEQEQVGYATAAAKAGGKLSSLIAYGASRAWPTIVDGYNSVLDAVASNVVRDIKAHKSKKEGK